MSDGKVHVFDPEVYPRKLFVVKGKKYAKAVKNCFKTQDGEALQVDDVQIDMVGSCTYPSVSFGETGMLGTLVWILDDASVKSLAHESVHVVNAIFKQTGVDMHYDHDEHYAYMLGWVVDCLWQVATGKLKD